MRRYICVLILLFAFFSLPTFLAAQNSGGGRGHQESGFSLGQNYPNPFNPETRIPFDLGDDLFVDGRPVIVSLRIYTILQQYVAAPTVLDHPRGDGTPLLNLEFAQPGHYEAYWDGTNRRGRQVASGMYFMRLEVNGRSVVRKLLISK